MINLLNTLMEKFETVKSIVRFVNLLNKYWQLKNLQHLMT